MRIAGLTGGIASGKSTCSALITQLGHIDVVDADKIAHDVTKKGRWGYRRVVHAFGPEILGVSGEIDRAKLGRLVFANKSLRRKLNTATHLPVGVELLRQLAWHWLRCRRVVVIDMPLLFETGMHCFVSPRILVYVQPGTQVRRLIARDGLSAEEAVARLQAQMPLEDKLRLADVTINNEGSLQQLEEQVVQVSKALRARATWVTWLTSPLAVAAGLILFTTVMLSRR